MALVSIMGAIGLAEEIGLVDWVGDLIGGNNGKEVAQKVVDTAQALTGISDPVKARDVINKDPALQHKLREKLLDQKHDLEKLAFANTAHAREMYKEKSDQADKIAQLVMTLSIPLIAFIAVIQVVAAYLIDEKALSILIANICGAAMGYLWNERATIINFFFGSSAGSKQKQQQLDQQKK